MKNVNWKELIIDHIEKGVLGLAGLIILVGLATTSWGTYDKRPSEFAEKVKLGKVTCRFLDVLRVLRGRHGAHGAHLLVVVAWVRK